MKKIPNKQGINMIIMEPVSYNICEIGGDHYQNKYTITMNPGDTYPDYMEVQAWIMENIDGKTLNIEDAVAMIYDMLEHEFHPVNLQVETEVEGCRTHFNVTVIK